MFLFDIKRIFSRDLQQNSLSEVNLSIQSEIFDLKRILLLFKAFFSPRNKRFFLRYEANFITIWSDILYLNRMSLSEANLYCDMKPFFLRIPLSEGNFSVWSDFLLWYMKQIFHAIFKRNPLSEVIYFRPVVNFYCDLKGIFYCDVKWNPAPYEMLVPPSGPPTEILRNLWVV